MVSHVDADLNCHCDICGHELMHEFHPTESCKCSICNEYVYMYHYDGNYDCYCDYCSTEMDHSDSETDGDMICDVCGRCDVHLDANTPGGDGYCDVCGVFFWY